MREGCVVNVATTPYYQRGQERLVKSFEYALINQIFRWGAPNWSLPPDWPSHSVKPYAFKGYALKYAANHGFSELLWCDSCIVLNAQIERIWKHAEEHGVWLSRNGWTNDIWTADSAYEALGVTFEENKTIPHVVATAFALNLDHPKGRSFLDEYYRLASETNAFCGPWTGGVGVQHRHDQTCASVIAWRLGIPLTNPPNFFAYKGGETDQTVLVADGTYS